MSAKQLKQGLAKASLPLLVLIVGIVSANVVIMSQPEPEEKDSAPQLRSVNTVRAISQSIAVPVESQGTVEPMQQISLVPQVSGVITRVHEQFVNGGRFSKGDLLVRIDDRDYQLAVTSARASVADARQQLETVRAQAEQAEADWKLLGRDAPTALALKKPQLAGAEARLLSAEADLERARLQLERTEIRAPFDGILTDKQVDIGQYISAGTALGQLSSSDDVEIRLAFPERELNHLPMEMLGQGSGIDVELQAMSGISTARWHGKLVRSEALLDRRTRNMTLVARLSGEQLLAADGSRLLQGQFVRARVQGRRFDDVVTLPRTALHNASSVFVIDDDSRLRQREVVLLKISETEILVAGGIRDGEEISISPLTSNVEGQQVRTVSQEVSAL